MYKTPIVLFTYARPEHTRCTVEALLKNDGAANYDLIIFSDAAKSFEARSAVAEVRAFLSTITGFRSIRIHHRPHNLGLAQSVIEGVSQVLSEYDRVIVLEDDLVTSPHFLTYMNEALDRFEHDERVISIHGYSYPVKQPLPEAFFLRGADCWGWATWKRGWSLFNPDGQVLFDKLAANKLLYAFDFNGTYSYSKMLQGQIAGLNDSWAVRWYASAFLADKLTLYPGRSLVHNIGNDGTGTHHEFRSSYDTLISATKIDLTSVEVIPSSVGRMAFESFFKASKRTIFDSLLARLKQLLKAAIK
jgi:hypothetical protein